MDMETRLNVFRELIDCALSIPLWRCDEDFTPLSSQPDSWVLGKLFLAKNQAQTVRAFASEHHRPLILTGFAELIWIIVPERLDERVVGYSVLGPVLISEPVHGALAGEIRRLGQPLERERTILDFVRRISVIPLGRVMEAALMLYYCVTGEKITFSDLHYQDASPAVPREEEAAEQATFHGTWAAEQEMLRMVREGNTDYKAQMRRVATAGPTGRLANGEQMRQMKNAVEVCITLFSRAAIDGGLSPETGLTLCDRYFQSVEACRDVAELTNISHTMQEDFVTRVHKIRTEGRRSPAIQACMDYIELHLEEPLNLKELAKLFNYSDYYFTRKFKDETGMTPKDYIRMKRLERGKFLLKTTTDSIQEISGRLQFCASSYFSDNFKKAFGMTPLAYRDGRQIDHSY